MKQVDQHRHVGVRAGRSRRGIPSRSSRRARAPRPGSSTIAPAGREPDADQRAAPPDRRERRGGGAGRAADDSIGAVGARPPVSSRDRAAAASRRGRPRGWRPARAPARAAAAAGSTATTVAGAREPRRPGSPRAPRRPHPNTATELPAAHARARFSTAPTPVAIGASDERGDGKRRVLADPDAARLRDDGPLGEGRKERVVVHGPAVQREPRRPVEERAREQRRRRHVAQRQSAARAVRAAPARRGATRARRGRPARRSTTPGPTRSTTPAPSCPRTAGSGLGVSPVTVFQSLRQTPLACRRTSTSARPGGARSSSSIANGLRCS